MIIGLMVVKDGRSVNKKMKRKAFKVVILYIVLCMVSGCGSINESNESNTSEVNDMESGQLSGTIPIELEYIPENYETPAKHQGTINKLTYETWESFTYEDHSQPLEKNAWVYLPYGYSNDQKYNIFYLSHGGWSNETTIMGTAQNPSSFKNVVDHAIEDGKMQPMILIFPTYNNTSENDSSDYSLALQLTDQFHNEFS